MTPSRTTLTLAALTALLCLAAPVAAGHEVVMNDGSRIAAASRPVIALGRVNFHDLEGRALSLSAMLVNLPETREALHRNGAAPTTTVWTASELESLRRDVRLQTAQVVGSAAEGPAEPVREGSRARSSTQAQIDVMQESLARVNTQRSQLRGDDPEARVLEERQIVIQSELLRLQTQREVETLAHAELDEDPEVPSR